MIVWPWAADLLPQRAASPRLAALRAAGPVQRADVLAVVADDYPLIEADGDGWAIVTLLAERPAAGHVYAGASTYLGFPQATPALGCFEPLDDSGLSALSLRMPADMRLAYWIATSTTVEPQTRLDKAGWFALAASGGADPFNRRTVALPHAAPGTPAVASVVELPDARADLWPTTPAPRHGTVRAERIATVGRLPERDIWAYVPDAPPGDDGHPLLVLLDGEVWSQALHVEQLLDSLIEQRLIPPLVVVAVASISIAERMRDLTLDPAFLATLGDSVLPWATAHTGATGARSRRAVGGWSLGGLTAAYAAMRTAHFGMVLSLSGSFWWPLGTPFDTGAEALAGVLAEDHSIAPLSWYAEVGAGEAIQLAQNRHLVNVARARGHRVTFTEFGGAHDLANARVGLAHGLLDLFGTPSPPVDHIP